VEDMIRPLKMIFTVLLMVAGGFLVHRFLDTNSEMIQLQFWKYRTKEMGLGSVVTLSFVIGLVISSGILTSSLISKILEARRLHRENEALQRLLETKTPETQMAAGDSAPSS
jgi:uncharacterized integral membrane protein